MTSIRKLPVEHQVALRAAWLDLCHAHDALRDREPDISLLIRAAASKLLDLYPDVSAILRRTHPDELED